MALAGCNDTGDLAPPSAASPWTGSTVIGAASASDPAPIGSAATSPTAVGPASGADDMVPAPSWQQEAAGVDGNHEYSLIELIDIAQRRNKDTRIAWEQARQAAFSVGIAAAAFLPEITASALGGYQHIASPFPANLVKQGYITANAEEIFPEIALRYLLIDFGRAATEQAARQLSFAANFGFNAAHQQLIFTVARDYFSLDGADAALRAAQRALVNARALQRSAEALQSQGLSTIVATQLAARGAAQAAYQVAQSVAAQHDATYALLQALELPPTTRLNVQESASRPLPRNVLQTVDRMMEEALRRRPDLLANLARLRAADAGVAAARAAFDPKLSLEANLQGNIGQISVDGGRYEGVQQPQTGLFLRFDWPLYQGGIRQNQLRQAESRRNAAEDSLEASTTQALRQVAQAYDELQTGLQQYDAAAALQKAAQTAFDSASDAFARGLGSFDDATNAETALAAADATIAKAHAQCLINAAALAFATGALAASDTPSAAAAAP